MEKIVDVTSARRKFGTILDEVFHKGSIFTIARKGKALAKIVPLENTRTEEKKSLSLQQKELLQELNSLPNVGIDKDPVEILRSMRKQKRIKSVVKQHDK
ncbi:type II toxin-antitoxin system Phd/YefM family antitoxin [Desulfobacter latus]|uniref:Type II toxin-antitoxin system Phd/YefM family antitoxin n=1 Tax=Desulfobacter latus TaxID=2292 RepID=A0A850T1R9_9BACT|nr:type II toxin-antitoxin system Phd/YefM family antitoxin [Desulfobacter latus]NWH05041.1 type II toxin-antitoxin system Phd/YefM family antitoxin [Desulfobacter latus]